MSIDPYLDLSARDRDLYVYRIISVPRLLEFFAKRENVLVKPRLWEDPFENFILNSPVQIPSGEIATISFRDKVYGQCWTRQTASDAMWRIYSPKANAVRIRSTPRRLAESLSAARSKWAQVEVFVGTVRYLNTKKLASFAANAFRDAAIPTPRMFANTLLVKRPAFKHEREIRLLFFPRDDKDAAADLFGYDVDPHMLVDQIMIDPRMSQANANALRAKIIRKTGFKSPIKRSLLYAPPPSLPLPFGWPNQALNRTRRKRHAG